MTCCQAARILSFAAVFSSLLVSSAAGAGAIEDPAMPLPLKICEEATVNLIDLLFLFDRVTAKSSTATSRNYLERISQPCSPLYKDYLEYKQGRISRVELVRRLPHVAMMGDSLTKNFYISSPLSMFWRARTERRKNWFLDTDLAPGSIYSLYERLDAVTPLVATEYAGDGALVADVKAKEDMKRRLVRTRHLAGQAKEILRKKRFPDLILVWIGHNNTDWTEGLSLAQRKDPDWRLRQIARQFGENYARSLRPMVERAKTEDHKVAFVVFGLANFRTFFKARKRAEALHAENQAFYPYLEADYRTFEALKPEYQKNMTRLSLMLDAEIRATVDRLRRQAHGYPNIHIEYSDALGRVDLSELAIINAHDAWHCSVKGHKIFAAAAFDGIRPALGFLGIDRVRPLRGQLVQHGTR